MYSWMVVFFLWLNWSQKVHATYLDARILGSHPVEYRNPQQSYVRRPNFCVNFLFQTLHRAFDVINLRVAGAHSKDSFVQHGRMACVLGVRAMWLYIVEPEIIINCTLKLCFVRFDCVSECWISAMKVMALTWCIGYVRNISKDRPLQRGFASKRRNTIENSGRLLHSVKTCKL